MVLVDHELKIFSSYIQWILNYDENYKKERYLLLGGGREVYKLNIKDNSQYTSIKGIHENTYCAMMIGDLLVVGGYYHIYFIDIPEFVTIEKLKYQEG